MEITEVRIFPRESEDRKLKAYATITIDNSFVVRNVKVIDGNKGLFVAMPSRKLRESCPKCRYKNAIRSRFCNQCAAPLPPFDSRPKAGDDSRPQSGHRDIAHPITPECREYIQKKVLDAYSGELKAGKPLLAPEQKKQPAPPEKAKETPKKESPAAPESLPEIGSDDDFEGDLEL